MRYGFFFLLLALTFACSIVEEQQPPYLAKATAEGLKTTAGDFIAYPEDTTTNIFFLVRHAEKREGENPGLTDEGRLRAHRLAFILEQAGLDVGFTTPYNRTMSTINPMSIRYQLPVMGYEPDKQQQLLDTLLIKNPGERVLIVGHSNTLPQLLNHLVGEERYASLPDTMYDRLFVVFSKGVGLSRVHEFRY